MSAAHTEGEPIGSTIAQSQAPTGGIAVDASTLPTSHSNTSDSRTMSRSPTVNDEDETDAYHREKLNQHLPTESTLGKVEAEKEKAGEVAPNAGANALADLPAGRKSILLLCFCLAMVGLRPDLVALRADVELFSLSMQQVFRQHSSVRL
jgi:hypothetical protein